MNKDTHVAAAPPVPSPTAGMSIAQRILHVGGRNNAAGYVEFGSTQAVEALVHQVLRDLPAQQPTPSAAPDDQMIAEYGRKASRMMARDQTRFDAGCEVMRYLKDEGAPYYYVHRMSIVLHGNTEGTEASRAPENAALQPSPTPQADRQPAPLSRQQICDKFSFLEGMVNEWGFDRIVSRAEEIQARAIAARAQADSVLEDAARYRWIRGPVEESTRYSRWRIEYWDGPNGWQPMQRERMDSAIDAARKQGGA